MHLYLTRDIEKGLDYNKEKSTFAVSRFFLLDTILSDKVKHNEITLLFVLKSRGQ